MIYSEATLAVPLGTTLEEIERDIEEKVGAALDRLASRGGDGEHALEHQRAGHHQRRGRRGDQ